MPGSPFDDPVPRGFNVVLATLRIVVALQCWGAASAILHSGDDFGLTRFLSEVAGLKPIWTHLWLDRIGWLLAACGLITLLRPCWFVLLPVTLWFGLVIAVATLKTRDWFRPAEQATLCMVPFALLLLDFWPPRLKYSLGRGLLAMFLLRVAAAAAFVAYGVKILLQVRSTGAYAHAVERVIQNVAQTSLAPEQLQSVLGILGGIAVGGGILLLFIRSRALALVLSGAGIVAAATAVLAEGPAAYPLVLLRSGLWGAVFAMFLHWALAVREQPPIVRPAR